MDETDRRRKKQIEHNEEHGITPQTIKKNISDIMQAVPGKKAGYSKKASKGLLAAEDRQDYIHMNDKELASYLNELEEKMYRHARDLEFEQAAAVRDEINKINEDMINIG